MGTITIDSITLIKHRLTLMSIDWTEGDDYHLLSWWWWWWWLSLLLLLLLFSLLLLLIINYYYFHFIVWLFTIIILNSEYYYYFYCFFFFFFLSLSILFLIGLTFSKIFDTLYRHGAVPVARSGSTVAGACPWRTSNGSGRRKMEGGFHREKMVIETWKIEIQWDFASKIGIEMGIFHGDTTRSTVFYHRNWEFMGRFYNGYTMSISLWWFVALCYGKWPWVRWDIPMKHGDFQEFRGDRSNDDLVLQPRSNYSCFISIQRFIF